ncbi:type VI secretion system protein TssA [Janthinobacterium sp. 1_2014MBL_MicDiv]|uniref:type VI secretion system protein TssA n=1 Tax=Janthinobacterium sp. 1_2014MBL_MicDiv TaxID=1644131 RepID=UPI0008F4C1CD|nr:type VI secretion system protein TssA [Janthinobacterium sp. 1_2014MBL_MicDiv]APA69166.1 type VI secretion protein [Janthinobacterium sp. 1_2014MBL_MicDiv]
MISADQLLLPISAVQPCGIDLSFSADLDAISQARKFDDPSLDQGEWVTDLKEADWDFVQRRCAALLAEKSKDLRLAAWLAEASARQDHLQGLGQGYRLLAGLCRQYWDLGLYPQADDGDHEQRIGNLSWILARTPALVRAMALTDRQSGGWSSIDFDAARKRAASNQDGVNGVKLADMEAARRNNSAQFRAAFAADAQFCLDALAELEQAADARLGRDSPGFSLAREALQAMQRALPPAAVAAPGAAAAVPPASVQVPGAGMPPLPLPAAAPGEIHSRAQALAQLRQVALYFRQTEPHSPVSYFADKAADAGEQTLHEWLRGVVKDSASLAHIEELLGVAPPAGQ